MFSTRLLVAMGGVLMVSLSAWAADGGKVRQIKIVADKAPDCSSLRSIVQTVTRGCKTNDEKAIAIYNFGLLAYYHHAYPREEGGIPALKMIHSYGWSLCGGQHTVLAAIWRAAGWEWRYIGWSGHTTVECKYDGQWHYFDTFLKFYAWKPDPNAPGGRTVASQDDIKNNPALVTDQFDLDSHRNVCYMKGNRFEIVSGKANWQAPAFMVCGDTLDGILSGVKTNKNAGSPTDWAAIKFDEDGYTSDVDLPVGMSLELLWRPIEGAQWFSGRAEIPRHSCGDKDYRNCPAIGPVLEPYRYLDPGGARTFSSGRLIFQPDMTNDAFLSGLSAQQNVKLEAGQLVPVDASAPASIAVRLQSPYVMSRASGSADGADKAEISLDGGKTFQTIDLKDFSDPVGGRCDALVKLTFAKALKNVKLEVIVQHNRCALPYLSPGRNKVTVSVADPKQLGDAKLVVTYGYALGSRDCSYEALAEAGLNVARAQHAEWSQTPTVVQKILGASDLPATVEIDVPTPKDKYPVYPRMLFLRREVISASSKPMPLPDHAVPPTVGPNDELKELPNPFLMGIAPPPAKLVRG